VENRPSGNVNGSSDDHKFYRFVWKPVVYYHFRSFVLRVSEWVFKISHDGFVQHKYQWIFYS